MTVNTLAHFRGLQHTDAYKSIYQGLDVQNDIAEEQVMSHDWIFFVLRFDFSTINHSTNLNEANRVLKKNTPIWLVLGTLENEETLNAAPILLLQALSQMVGDLCADWISN
jgi:hypothetical protein